MKRLMAGAGLALMLVMPGSAFAEKTVLTADLSGKEETPDDGDQNATGTAKVTLDDAKGTVCFVLSAKKVDAPTAGHIHSGKKGKSGPVKVDLFAGTFKKKGCTKNVSASQIKAIVKRPGSFYVNLHNDDFAGGAMRGQLEASDD